jgi:hypothetical protein
MKINDKNHHHLKNLCSEHNNVHILRVIDVLQIIANYNASFILDQIFVEVDFISENLFQWYTFLTFFFIDYLSDFSIFDCIIFYLRRFSEIFCMKMSKHRFIILRWFWQIVYMKFWKRYCFYFWFKWFRDDCNHKCCIKHKNFQFKDENYSR